MRLPSYHSSIPLWRVWVCTNPDCDEQYVMPRPAPRCYGKPIIIPRRWPFRDKYRYFENHGNMMDVTDSLELDASSNTPATRNRRLRLVKK